MPRRIEFGYNPPTGTRQIEVFEPRTFVRDLQSVLDVASQAFSSLWVSDHLMTVEPFRMECWTRADLDRRRAIPGPLLGTIVMANSYRHPPLMAKMAASLQAFSHGRLILGYGAGWHETEYRAYGYDFPTASVRIEQMVEGIQVMRAMWTRRARRTSRAATTRSTTRTASRGPSRRRSVMIGGDGEQLRCKRGRRARRLVERGHAAR